VRKTQFVTLARVMASMRPAANTNRVLWQGLVDNLADWCQMQAKPYRGTDGQLKAGFQRDKWIAMCNGEGD